MDYKMRARKLYLIGFLVIGITFACSMPTGEGGEGGGAGDAVQTNVAGTLQAEIDAAGAEEQATETALPAPTSTVPATETPLPPEPDISYQGVSFSFPESLADSVSTGMEEGMPDAQNPWAIPPHIRMLFNGYPLSGTFHEPQILVFSVQEFRDVNPDVGAHLDNLAAILESQPQDPDVFVAHFFNAGQFLKTQEAYLSFRNGHGVRYVSQYGQAAIPIGYPEMFYTFQGLTEDGAYYVSVILPVSHPSLPEAESVNTDQEFYDNYREYTAEVQAQLDGQPAESFIPSLLSLDAMVETLLVESE